MVVSYCNNPLIKPYFLEGEDTLGFPLKKSAVFVAVGWFFRFFRPVKRARAPLGD